MKGTLTVAACALALVTVWTASGIGSAPPDSQLETVRSNIDALKRRLERLATESADVEHERERLNAELDLARARVLENELTLEQTELEQRLTRDQVSALAEDLSRRRQVLGRQLEMVALLGQPGPLQLMFDVARQGELEHALATVAVLTSGQARLLEEYNKLRAQHGARLAALSQLLQQTQHEAAGLAARRHELEATRARVEARLEQLKRSQEDAGVRLTDLKEREHALERLMGLLATKERITGREDIRSYRGALPWPVEGRVVRSFGRHFLPTYSTYTICNGVRFAADSGAQVRAVFPGVVAFARHFKGYGNMVVVDHGHDVYSLVAGLATIHVRLDQRVTMGLQLGLAAPPKDDGNLYFEIRVGEKPDDPRRWLQLEEGR